MSRYAPRRPSDVANFIAQQVLGIVMTRDALGYIATPLPLLAETGEDGEIRALIGHFAIGNPHFARVEQQPMALITFLGPHGYVAPAMVSRVGWAPTWNYQFAQMEVTIELEPALNDQAIASLVRHMEGDGDGAWSIGQAGARYAKMLEHVVAFRAQVHTASARFKLGQDEDRTSFNEILAALGPSNLTRAMRAQRPD